MSEMRHETYWRPLVGQNGWERYIHGLRARILPAQVNREYVYDLQLKNASGLMQLDLRELCSLAVAKSKAVLIAVELRHHVTVPRKRKPSVR